MKKQLKKEHIRFLSGTEIVGTSLVEKNSENKKKKQTKTSKYFSSEYLEFQIFILKSCIKNMKLKTK